MSKAIITTIKPTAGLYVSFAPRSKEGEEKKPEVFALLDLPPAIANLPDGELRTFAVRAYGFSATEALRLALKEGQQEFIVPGIAEAFAPKEGKEYLITRKDLESWLTDYALPIIESAIAAKAGRPVTDVKVVKKALSYKDILLGLTSRSIMKQEDIDSIIRTLTMLESTGKSHTYSENVAKATARKQEQLDAFMASGNEEAEDDGLDF